MISIPWTIYHQNLQTQWDDQWEFILFEDESSFAQVDTTSFSSRIISYFNNVALGRTDSGIAIPQSRITKISFPLPFPEFKTNDLPNKMNVYNAADFDNRDVTVSFTEDTRFRGYRYFKGWFDKIYDSEKRQFKPNAETVYKYGCVAFKKKGLVNEFGLIDKTSIRFDFHRLKLVGFDKRLDLTYNDGKPLEFTATMKVEKVVDTSESINSFSI